VKNPEVDETGKQIGWLHCDPQEWEERCDTFQCEKCGNNMNEVSGWDEDCNDYTWFYCPMCGWTEGEQ